MSSDKEPKILTSSIPYIGPDTENLCHFLVRGLDQHADKVLVIGAESGRKWTGAKIKSTSLQLASLLVEKCNFKKGQVCSIFLEENDLVPICMLAVLMAGGTFNYLTSKNNTGRDIRDTAITINARVLISNATVLRRISEQLGDLRESLKVVSLDELPDGYSKKSFELHGFLEEEYQSDDCLKEKPKNLLDWDTTCPDKDFALIQFSSGTTGKPKPIPRTHKNSCHLVTSVDHEELMDLKPGVVVTGSLSLAYRPGTWALFACIKKGSTLVVWNRLSDIEDAFSTIERYGVTLFSSSVLFLTMLGDASDELVNKYNLSSLKHMITSGAKIINKSLPEKVVKMLKLETLRQCFGMTESGWVFLIEKSLAQDNYLFVGHVCPGTEAKIVDRETRKILPPNVPGEIAIRGPQIFPGYLSSQGPSLLLNRSDFTDDGFFLIGDQGFYDEDDLITISGRYKELLILPSGERFFPSEIESLIMEHPSVECACVVRVSVKKDCPFDLVKACITVRAGMKVTEQEIIDFVAKHSQRIELGGGIEILSTFPRMQNGKIDKQILSKSIMR